MSSLLPLTIISAFRSIGAQIVAFLPDHYIPIKLGRGRALHAR